MQCPRAASCRRIDRHCCDGSCACTGLQHVVTTPSSRRASQRAGTVPYGWVPSLHSLGDPGIARSVQLQIASLSVSSKKSTCAQK